MMNRSLEEMTRTSAGIMSPAESFTRSPGTSSCSGISRGWPSRTTVAVTLIIALSLAAAESARDSWTNRSVTPKTTISTITPALASSARLSATQYVTTANTERRITSGLRMASSSRTSQPRCFSWATSFGPYRSKRSAASACVSPDDDVSRPRSTSSVSFSAASLSSGETRIAAGWPLASDRNSTGAILQEGFGKHGGDRGLVPVTRANSVL